MKEMCFSAGDLLLPKSDFSRFAVIACDQYTSEPEYWEKVSETVGDTPSALHMVFPEAWLGTDDAARIASINRTMEEYLQNGAFNEFPQSMVYVERTQSDGTVRYGVVGTVDLAAYDYHKGTKAAIRATEQTVLERIPPRVKIRENAPLELPHAMLLTDDPDDLVFAFLKKNRDSFPPLYDFDLMQNGGHLRGWLMSDAAIAQTLAALEKLEEQGEGLLFCVGDGNHSLASAKACWEQNPEQISRYAAVEIVNIHDPALQFEPIYRVVFGVEPEQVIGDFVASCGGEYTGEDAQRFTCVFGAREITVSVRPSAKLAVGTLQEFLDGYLAGLPQAKIDYIHGEENLRALCGRKNTVGFLFSGMRKDELFPAVRADGSLPRKTFSMGHADDKRFYLEARKIRL